jgi:UV DNA damage repair endonuclease
MDHPRIGYCCLYRSPVGDLKEEQRFNMTGTTVTALARMERSAAFEKVVALVARNIQALENHLRRVATSPPLERLLRLDSDILPAYTHPVARWMYDEPLLRELVESGLAEAGRLASEGDVRLSLHPGPFCVLASPNPAAVENGIGEMEYHTDLLRWMGFAGGWHPRGAHINIHVGSAATGVAGFRAGLQRLSEDARNLITVENDETSFDLDSLLPLADALPIVLDLHHEWISSGGRYIQPDDPRIPMLQKSWRGVRPVAHLSVSRETELPDHAADVLPDYAALIATGASARGLRGHSDLMWNEAVNAWAASHLVWADLEVEAKRKNVASHQLAVFAAERLATEHADGQPAARRRNRLDGTRARRIELRDGP